MHQSNHLFIGGQWTAATDPHPTAVISPSTEGVIAELQFGGPADVDRAVASAHAAFTSGPWANSTVEFRADALSRFVDELSARTEAFRRTIADEAGLPVVLGPIQVSRAIEFVQYYADLVREYPMAESRSATMTSVNLRQVPLGPIAAIGPWNIPLLGALSKVAPALAAGCTVVFKPSPETPLTALLMAEAAEAADLPPGVLNVVPVSQAGSEALVADRRIAKVGFTGSTAVGHAIALECARQLKPYTLELGGNAAAIICDDAPLEDLGPGLAMTALALSNGEACIAQRRIMVPRHRRDEVVATLCAIAPMLRVGDPREPTTVVGPLISAAHRKRVLDHVADGVSQGATAVYGGGIPEGKDRGFYFEPTVLVDVEPDMRIAREETFGPVVCVMTYDDLDEAIRIANDTHYGLSASIWTEDQERADEIANKLEAGSVFINGAMDLDPNVPFGGFKESGVGRELGPEGLSMYMQVQSVMRPPL